MLLSNKRRVLQLLFLGAATTASAFSPSHMTTTSRFALSPPLASTTSETAVHVESASDLLPEYQAVLDQAKTTLMHVLKSSSDGKEVDEMTLQKNKIMLQTLNHFCSEYIHASQASFAKTQDEAASPKASLERILEGVGFGFQYGMGPEKYVFGVTHQALRGNEADVLDEKDPNKSLDFYEWGCNFFRPFIDIDDSLVLGQDNLQKAMEQTANGENVIFFANHQSEADPQVMSLLLEKAGYEKEASKVVYVAGHKVTTDALAIPFSMGRNLICIHSKKHIDADPDTKSIKSRQNLSAMSGMLKQLKEGGCMLWVAPSGGRDRRDVETGKTPMAPFDSKTLDMFRLMGNKSKKPTHLYPLAMVSYELCPPPDVVEAGTGEQRNFRFVPVGIKVGEELINEGGLECRQTFNEHTFDVTNEDYVELREALFPGTAPEIKKDESS